MLGNWQNWCRLCAKSNSSEDKCFHKTESISDQLEIVNKHFTISLVPLEGILSWICNECHSFLAKLDNYGEQCLRVDQMFRELILRKDITDADLQSIRVVYGIDREEVKYSNVLTEDKKETRSSESVVIPDPLDSEDENEISVKEESSPAELSPVRRTRKRKKIEKQITLIPRKRGRPRKCTQQQILVNPKAEVKEETKFSDSDADSAAPEQDLDDTSDYVPDDLFDQQGEQPEEEKKPHKNPRKRSKISTDKENECEFCSKKFCRRSVLKEHILEQHRPDELPHVCSKCSRRFISKYKLKVHESTHLSEAERRNLPCPYCEKKFAKKFILQSHIHAMHIGDKPYVCEECGNSFRTISALNQHQTIHSDERPYQCASCPKKFKKTQHLKRHEESHTDKMYECPHCDLKLKTTRTLRMHLLVHSDDKKYKCHYCGNEYKRSKTLKDHLILHTGQRPYECPFCDKTFANNSNCRSHKRKAHPVELAALEASGEQQPMRTIVPKLEHLQPKQSTTNPHDPEGVKSEKV
ncbi:zinc finger protein weckle-like [Lutzomyia longipalpis]|uniref:zinc finger protein weckle-like n=1 Tax=Lutzomyia longipalpis TaxID=7200 RepID=UPI0024841DF1|nr:zinc finger protein weckle-like [Lutzomyia longipalpis]